MERPISVVHEARPQVGAGETVISLADLIAVIRAYWFRLGLVVLVVTGIGAAYAFLTPRYYHAESKVVVERNTQAGGGLAALASQMGGLAQLGGLGLGANIERGEAMAMLESRSLAERVITKYKLMDQLFPPDERSAGDPAPTMWRAVKKFNDDVIQIEDNRLTAVITVSCEWTDPGLAAHWANLVVAEANLVSRERAIADADRGIGYLEKELEKNSSVEVREAIYRLIESQLNQRMLANVRVDYIVRAIDPATIPERPSRPKRLLLMAVSLVVGCFFAAVAVLVLAARAASRRA